jgi:hypothetical protein
VVVSGSTNTINGCSTIRKWLLGNDDQQNGDDHQTSTIDDQTSNNDDQTANDEQVAREASRAQFGLRSRQ